MDISEMFKAHPRLRLIAFIPWIIVFYIVYQYQITTTVSITEDFDSIKVAVEPVDEYEVEIYIFYSNGNWINCVSSKCATRKGEDVTEILIVLRDGKHIDVATVKPKLGETTITFNLFNPHRR